MMLAVAMTATETATELEAQRRPRRMERMEAVEVETHRVQTSLRKKPAMEARMLWD